MAKDLKIKDEQLTELQSLVSKINQAQMTLGQVEAQKYELIASLPKIKKDLQDFQMKLEEEYGKVSINIQDGTIQEIPVENGKADS
jgi:seryl-tRNA synthetase